MSDATILIPPFGAMVPEVLRTSFWSIKECGIASDTSDRTVARWWRGERLPDAAQWLLMQLNSDPFSARTQLLHDELKQQRTDVNARIERLRATRPGAVADLARKRMERVSRIGNAQGGGSAAAVRSVAVGLGRIP